MRSRPTIPNHIRKAAVAAIMARNGTVKEVAAQFKMSVSSLKRFIKMAQQCDGLPPRTVKRLGDHEVTKILAFLATRATPTPDDVISHLRRMGVVVSKRTLHRTLCEHNVKLTSPNPLREKIVSVAGDKRHRSADQKDAIHNLPKRERTLLKMYLDQGMSQDTIATKQRMAKTTVATILRRASDTIEHHLYLKKFDPWILEKTVAQVLQNQLDTHILMSLFELGDERAVAERVQKAQEKVHNRATRSIKILSNAHPHIADLFRKILARCPTSAHLTPQV